MIRSNTPQVGDTIYAFKHDVWWPAEVLASYPDGSVLVHYPGRPEMGEDEFGPRKYRCDSTGIRAETVMPHRTDTGIVEDRQRRLPSIRKSKPQNPSGWKGLAVLAVILAVGLGVVWWNYGFVGIPDLIATDNQKALNAYSRGNTYLKRGKHKEAIKEFDTALKYKARFFEAVHNRGVAYSRLGKHKTAIDDFTKAIDLRPRDDKSYFNRGVSYWETNQFKEAIKDYTKVLELAPGDISARYNRGLAYSKAGLYEKALKDFETVVQLAPRGRIHHKGKVQLKAARERVVEHARNLVFNLDQPKKGIAILTRMVKSDPKDQWARFSRGQAYMKLEQYKAALADFDEVAKQHPEKEITYTVRATVHQAMKNYDKALADRRKAVELLKRRRKVSAESLALANNNLAWFLSTCPVAKLRDGEEAIPLAIKACRLTDWKEGMYLDTLAAAFAEAGYFDFAVAYQKLALNDPNFIGVLKAKELREARSRLKLFGQKQTWVEP